MTYQVKQNKLNNCRYITFKRGDKRYKVQKLNDTDVYVWVDKSCSNDYQNIKLLKIIKSDCNKNDFEALYAIANNYLSGVN